MQHSTLRILNGIKFQLLLKSYSEMDNMWSLADLEIFFHYREELAFRNSVIQEVSYWDFSAHNH